MNWLQGGPYYELSFLIQNQEDKKNLIKEIMAKINQSSRFKIVFQSEELEELIELYVNGDKVDGKIYRSLNINTQIKISGNRKSRLFIQELSDELLKVNFWFYGSRYDAEEWNQIGLKDIDKPEFRDFFNFIKNNLNPILGTIAYEEDCEELFSTEEISPSQFYSTKNLSLENITERVNRNVNEYELCWVNGQIFGQNENLEIEIKTA